MKVTETVFLVGGGETETVFTDGMDCNVYLMQAGDLYLLIDSGGGMAADQVVDNIRGHGVDPARVEWLLLTHAHGDHAAGAAPLKQRLPNLKSGPLGGSRRLAAKRRREGHQPGQGTRHRNVPPRVPVSALPGGPGASG